MNDGVWPRVQVDGTLGRAESEWIATNGAGAYAMSTVALMHTRRFHGMLVAALEPPFQRHLVLSHVESVVEVGKKTYRLSTHQFPNVAPTLGYKLLEQFALDPLPRWTYRLGREKLVRDLCLVRGHNTVVIAYTWHGHRPARLSLRPLLAMRPFDQLMREHGGMVQRVMLRKGEVQVQPIAGLPPVVFGHDGAFLGSPDWWRSFEYVHDRAWGLDCEEDLWAPGTFQFSLEPYRTAYLTVSLGAAPDGAPAEHMARAAGRASSLDPGVGYPLAARRLAIAADHFRADACEQPAVIAGYPWFEMHLRDALISLPGLYLCTGRLDEARELLRRILASTRPDGLLPRRIRESGLVGEHSSVDASLWLFDSAERFIQVVGADDAFVRESLVPALVRMFEVITAGAHPVRLGPAGLVWVAATTVPATWMDASEGNVPITPRTGAPIELQGLWARACSVVERVAGALGDAPLADRARAARAALRDAVRARFWSAATGYALDCLPADADTDAEPWIRPNAVIALAVAPDLFEHWQGRAILDVVRRRLLTPRGLRSLEPTAPAYVGAFEGTIAQRRLAYHQGAAWPYLLGCFARAAVAVSPDDFELRLDIQSAIEQAMTDVPLILQVPQLGAGDPPYPAGGCPAAAWSVAELLRSLLWDLELAS